LVTFTPGALSSTRLINLLTTGKLTSASNRALLTSFKGALIFSGDKSATPFIFAHAWSKVADKLLNASALTIKLEDLPFFPLRPERSERPLSSLFLPAAAAAPPAPNRGEIDEEKEILFLIVEAAPVAEPRALVDVVVVAIIIAFKQKIN